jgi:Predicted transporter component
LIAKDNSFVLTRKHLRAFRCDSFCQRPSTHCDKKNSDLLCGLWQPPNRGCRRYVRGNDYGQLYTHLSRHRRRADRALCGSSDDAQRPYRRYHRRLRRTDDPTGSDRAWRATFIAGLIAAPVSAVLLGLTLPLPQMPSSLTVIAVGGLLVGFGTRLSNGCTSGHGVCGIARLSPRSIAATAIFMTAAIAVVALTRHVFGA